MRLLDPPGSPHHGVTGVNSGNQTQILNARKASALPLSLPSPQPQPRFVLLAKTGEVGDGMAEQLLYPLGCGGHRRGHRGGAKE